MLYPGKEHGPRTIGLARLKPGVRYVLTGATQEGYANMMLAGGRSPNGNRSKSEWSNR